MTTLARVGEFGFIDAIANLAAPSSPVTSVKIGIGDDAAVVAGFRSTLLTTDTMTAGVHFEPAWIAPRALGRRAFRVAVSDIAAMGGTPRYALLSLAMPPDYEVAAGRALVAGLVADAESVGAVLVGGNVSRSKIVSITVTVVGEGPRRPLARDRARPGDAVLVTGTVGDAAAGVELLGRGVDSGALVEAYRRPPLRIDVGRALAGAGAVRAMIDVSDGVGRDLHHICRASKVSAVIDPAALPLSRMMKAATASRPARSRAAAGRAHRLAHPALRYALGGGDDYELLFTVPAKLIERVESLCAKHGCVVSRIGEIVAGARVSSVLDPSGRVIDGAGYTHFE